MPRILLIMFFCASVFGYQASPRKPEPMIIIDSSANTVPTAYDATAGSQVVTAIAAGVTRLQVFNTGGEYLAVYVGKGPCASAPEDHFMVPKTGGNEALQVSPGDHVCIRTLAAPQVVGLVTVSQW